MPTSAHDGTYQDTTVELSWDPVEGAENYRVVVQDASTKTPTANSVTYALKPGTYTWRVRAENGSGNSEWTEWQDFEVKACPYIEVYDGDVHSQVEIDSDLLARVPAGYLLKGGNRGKEGVASSRNAPRIGNYSEENWVSQTDYSLITGPEYVSFDLLERKIPDHGSPPCGLGDKSCWEGAGLFEQDGEDNEAYYHVTGDLNTPDEEVEVTGDRKLILFVEDKIRIRGNIIMGPDAYLMLVSGGGIDIESDVTRVEGVYYTTGIINTKVD